MLIDSHAHLDMSQFKDDLDEVVERARSACVGEILNVGYNASSMNGVLALTARYEEIYAALGVHPHNAKDYDGSLEKKLKQLILRKKVLAVGEIGLDYHRDLSPREKQREVFRKQIGIAVYFGKPIIVHCREAFGDVMDILREEGAGEVGGIFHAFSGGIDEAAEVMKLGFLIGIGGPLTYKNSRLPEVASRLPSASIVLETDCPYLPPAPYRGKRNEPSYVGIVAEKLAGILGVGPEDVERTTEVNYRRLLHGKRGFPPAVVYVVKGNVYINVTSTCTNDCTFCPRFRKENFLYGYNLNLAADPSVGEMVAGAEAAARGAEPGEIVFCGYGEPTTRLKEILETAAALGGLGIPIRLNTNGHGNKINRRNIVPELERVFGRISVSLNAPDGASYTKICRPGAGEAAFESVLDFIRKAAASRMECVVTALDHPATDLDACRSLVESIPGAAFRARRHHLSVPEE